METLFDRPNKDKTFCSSINPSKYEQSYSKNDTELYSTLIELFLSRYDPAYSLLDDKEKELYILQKIASISSEIDEKSDTTYTNFNYCKKFKSSLIQTGLQINDSISSVLYLNDLYKITTVVIHGSTKYTTSPKNYKNYYITKNKGKWMEITNIDQDKFSEGSFDELGAMFVLDYPNIHIHQPFLKPIQNYKADELVKLAKELNISLTLDGKKKIKKQLYNDINICKLNLM